MADNLKPQKFVFKTDYSRRFPDPLNLSVETPIEHHVLLMRARDMPEGLSLDPNPREQNPDKKIYKEVRASLDDRDDLTFHLKNKGITVFAQRATLSDDKKIVTAYCADGDGIADGGHTYRIIMNSIADETCPHNQYVRVEIITGIGKTEKGDIAEGLNTSVQVQEASLMNLAGNFEWIKEELQSMPYKDEIAYSQNQDGEYDIRDLVAFMTLFNVEHPQLKGKAPKIAYTSKKACIDRYSENPESYKMLSPILRDILHLHDHIHLNIADLYDDAKKGKARRMVGVFERKEKGVFRFLFTNKESDRRLYDGTFFPIFGAMRYLVEEKNGAYQWKLGSIDNVIEFFNEIAAELLEATYNTGLVYGRKPNSVGKDDNLWKSLHQTVEVHYLRQQAAN